MNKKIFFHVVKSFFAKKYKPHLSKTRKFLEKQEKLILKTISKTNCFIVFFFERLARQTA